MSREVDLSKVRAILQECGDLADEADRSELLGDDGRKCPDFAERTRRLNLLADRFDLAAALTRHELWYARGEADALNEDSPSAPIERVRYGPS